MCVFTLQRMRVKIGENVCEKKRVVCERRLVKM